MFIEMSTSSSLSPTRIPIRPFRSNMEYSARIEVKTEYILGG